MTDSTLVCAGCGAALPPDEPYPFRCPNAAEGDVDHVLRRRLDLALASWPGDVEPRPFVRWRTLLHSYRLGRRHGLTDAELVELIETLDERVAALDGHGFRVTPFARADELSDELGFSERGGVWVKDETGNVSGSHKARHLFGVLLQLEVADRLGLTASPPPQLAIASCGNAALAAAVVAAAANRRLEVFVPEDADPAVLERLGSLGAWITICERHRDIPGDPTVARLRLALQGGALPFTCQGDLNGLAIEGGQTLGWELAASGVALDRIVVQVGGGALASAVAAGLDEAHTLRAIARVPRLDTVQTEGAWPLKRAFDAVRSRPGGIAYARTHRSAFMRPWPTTPHSVAHGILDDETYDWAAVVEAMMATRGDAVVVDEQTLVEANRLARTTTGVHVDPTGSSGLAGVLALRDAGAVGDDERVAVLFTGVDRTHQTPTEGRTHEELLGAGHSLAQGFRAR
ncbi:MAG: pyridoxal-phosphate dependent enzyme [Gaiellaceae bacterium]